MFLKNIVYKPKYLQKKKRKLYEERKKRKFGGIAVFTDLARPGTTNGRYVTIEKLTGISLQLLYSN